MKNEVMIDCNFHIDSRSFAVNFPIDASVNFAAWRLQSGWVGGSLRRDEI